MGAIESFGEGRPAPNTASERVQRLMDPGSFAEIGVYATDSGVTTGYGTVEGRLVYAYSQSGPVNLAHAKKIRHTYQMALKTGAPVVGILDSRGIRVDEGAEVLEAYGSIFSVQSEANGVVPQISVIMGECMGLSAFIVGLSDFVIMLEKDVKLFLESPATYRDGKFFDREPNGHYHTTETGLAHASYYNEEACLNGVRGLLRYLPSNLLEDAPPVDWGDDLNREAAGLNAMAESEPNMPGIIATIVDSGDFFELQKIHGPAAIVGFGRFGGYTAGIVANNGKLEPLSMRKILRFVNFCDAFGLPIVTLTDNAGYDNGIRDDKRLLEDGAALIYAFCNATVPKVNVIVRDALGSAYLMMNSKFLGADIVYAWPTARVAVMDPAAAQKNLGLPLSDSPVASAEKGIIDDIIYPSATRKRIVAALEMLSSKRTPRHPRKHGSLLV